MYVEEVLKAISKHLNKSIDEVLEIYQGSFLFVPHNEDPKIGKVVKECEYMNDIKLKELIFVENAEYLEINDDLIGITTDIFKVYKYNIPKPKKKETKKEATGHNIAKAVKLVAEWFELDPDYAMDQIKFANEKIKMRNKLIKLGFETKEQRKYVHNAIKNCNRRIKELGVQGAAEDTAEKYKIEAKLIKHIRGFQNNLFANPFK
jgi:hypothetical protein